MNLDIKSVRVSLGGDNSIVVTCHDSGVITVHLAKYGLEQPGSPLPGFTADKASALAEALSWAAGRAGLE